jgi:hypothetical protein
MPPEPASASPPKGPVGLAGQVLDDSRYGPSPRRRGSGNWLTHILIAVLGAVLAAGLLLAFNGPGSGDSGGLLLGMGSARVSAPRLRARSPLASSSARARLAKPSRSPACPAPVGQRRLADARFLPQHQHRAQLAAAAASTLQGERSRTGWPAYGVHVISAVSFSVLPAIAHVSVRVALAAPNSACRPAGRARTSPVGTFCPPGPRRRPVRLARRSCAARYRHAVTVVTGRWPAAGTAPGAPARPSDA